MIAGRPCVLIADDDPLSLRYLSGALEQFGCSTLAAESHVGALGLLSGPTPAVELLLLDRRMPGGGGIDLLRALRASGVAAPAIATSAELDSQLDRSLREAGFASTLLKPAPLAHIHALVARFVGAMKPRAPAAPADARPGLPLLDDAAALATLGGDRPALIALRRLFAAELTGLTERYAGPEGVLDRAQTAERLHRLRAACSICGAVRLRAATVRLDDVLRRDPTGIDEARKEFVSACDRTLGALTAVDAA